MAVRGVITEFFDLPEFQKQISAVKDGIGKYIDLVKTAPAIRTGLSDPTKVKETLNGMKQIADQNEKVGATMKVVVNNQRELDKAVLEAKISQQEYNKELKQEINLQNAATGSIKEAKAQIASLSKERDNLNLKTEEGRKRAEAINKEIDKQNTFIKTNSSELEKQRLNIGNYQGSAKIIVDALEKARVKVEQVTAQLGPLSPEAQAARKEFEALGRVTENPQFLNIAAKVGDTNKELRFFQQQLNTLEDAGLKNSQVYTEVRARLAQLTDQLADTRQEIKALSSDTAAIDRFAEGLTAATDIFQIGAGAAALFGEENESLQKTIATLTAIENVSNGVRSIANQLTTKGTLLNKAYALAVGTSTGAMKAFRIALAATGVGLLIVGVVTLVEKLGLFSEATDSATKAQEKFNKELEREKKLFDQTQQDIEDDYKRRVAFAKQAGASEEELNRLVDKGILQQKIAARNDAQRAQLKLQLAQSTLNYLKAEGTQGKTLENQEKQVEQLTEAYEKYNQVVNDLDIEEQERKADRLAKAREKEKDAAEKAAEEARKRADAQRQVQFEILRVDLQRYIDFNKEIADDETKSSEERLFALQKYLYLRERLINLQANTEKRTGQKTSAELILIERKRADEIIRLNKEVVDKSHEILKNGVATGLGLKEEEKNHLDKLGEQVLDGFKNRAEKQIEAIKKLNETERQIAENKKELYHDLYGELSGFAIDFFTAQQDREIARNQEEITAIDQRRQKEIDAINQTVTDRKKAQEEISIIEAKAQADKAVLENKNKELERRKANIEKLGQVATIAGNTAQGIVSLSIKATEARAQAALLAANPLTAAFAPVALAQAALITSQIPIVIAIGAAQIARLVLPRFKHGGITPGGPVIVGDGGKSEGVKLPDGNIIKTPDTPTVMNLPKGSQVFPDFSSMMLSATIKELPDVRVNVPYDKKASEEIRSMRKDIVRAIKDKQENHFHFPSRYETYMREGSLFRAYLKENL